ncbi:putative Ubiquitin-conjugating enzyme E2 Z [Blattamonas nauphoetae]|uniref:Ubiquitin-conjugating enzyme E2 Z n=1 Tax=Blattamonas nauphoetae TaxID=2049346 RepID=A0ABQ9YFN4_9EUKA|nr:putative Ubiquitin-conjugating enzyme E2 Z [Blattamonas nauphoetae]
MHTFHRSNPHTVPELSKKENDPPSRLATENNDFQTIAGGIGPFNENLSSTNSSSTSPLPLQQPCVPQKEVLCAHVAHLLSQFKEDNQIQLSDITELLTQDDLVGQIHHDLLEFSPITFSTQFSSHMMALSFLQSLSDVEPLHYLFHNPDSCGRTLLSTLHHLQDITETQKRVNIEKRIRLPMNSVSPVSLGEIAPYLAPPSTDDPDASKTMTEEENTGEKWDIFSTALECLILSVDSLDHDQMLVDSPSTIPANPPADLTPSTALQHTYEDILSPLQLTFTSQPDFVTNHTFSVRLPLQVLHPNIARIGAELSIIQSSLPFDFNSSIFVVASDQQSQLLKALIIPPSDTPYEHGMFEFDIYFPENYPVGPPQLSFVTTGGGTVRFNPNLYESGRVCLSLLGTWTGSQNECWNSEHSTLLQVLVSIQSMIFVDDPYFNEPGFNVRGKTELGKQECVEYTKGVKKNTVRWAIINQLQQALTGHSFFSEVIKQHCLLKRDIISHTIQRWSEDGSCPADFNSTFLSLVSQISSQHDSTSG